MTAIPHSPADPAETEAIVAAKKAARDRARAVRAAIPPQGRAEALVRAFTDAFPALAPGSVVAAYWPKGDELDVRPLLRHFDLVGVPTALPVMAGRGWPLLFRLWRPGHPLVPGAFGVMEPMAEAPLVQPTLVLVPLLAFDRSGHRLGYGAGFYDRTLAALRDTGRVTAIGVAHAEQQVDAVPHDPYDQRLDGVLTDQGLIPVG